VKSKMRRELEPMGWAAIGLAAICCVGVIAYFISPHDSAGASVSAPTTATVRYEVEGTASDASVTYSTPTGTEQADVNLPMKSASGAYGITATFPNKASAHISAQNRSDSGTVTCRITVNGEIISENTSSASYGIAQCHS